MPEPQFVPGIGSFADRFDGFVLDQWGVLHDGSRPYPWVQATLEELKRRGKRIVLLSNSGRRAAHNRLMLEEMGFDPAMFDATVTSGETAWLALRDRRIPEIAALGRRCLLLTRQGDRTVAEDVGLDLVETPEEADFVFLSGVAGPLSTLDDYLPLLAQIAPLRLPMLCSNPDLVAVAPGPTLYLAPGSVAEAYERLGGTVVYVGKPHLPIYAACLEALADVERSRIIAIGDSLQHDIRGANGAGIKSAFIHQGIHAAEFLEDAALESWQEALGRLAAHYAARPDYAIPRLVW